jgi:hypothetical protein
MKDNIMPLPYKEPSLVLAGLLDKIVDEGRRFASAGDIKVSDMSSQSPVGTTLAILERTLKVMSAVQSRIHYSMKQEFRLLKKIIAEFTPEDYNYEPTEGSRRARRSDYDMVDVIPVSDPNAATMSQKVVQYQAALQLAQTAPQLYNLPLLHRQMLDILGIKNANKLVPMMEDHKPTDPISENMNVIKGKPLKAFIYQDHQAHIQVHMNAMQDPKIAMLIGQNPQAQTMQAAMMAHINEHIAFEYRKQMEEMIGVPVPYTLEEDEGIPQEIELQISRLAAAASAKLLQRDQNEMAAMQAQQADQDPLVQIQKQEMALKAKEVQIKEKKLMADAAAKADQLRIERDRIESQEKIAGMNATLKFQKDTKELQAKQVAEGLKMGVEYAKANKPKEKQ